MRKTLGVAALLLALCCPALAGEIPNPPAPSDGIIQTGAPATVDDAVIIHGDGPETLTQIILTALVSVLP
jgi:hypothetical protein